MNVCKVLSSIELQVVVCVSEREREYLNECCWSIKDRHCSCETPKGAAHVACLPSPVS